MSKNYALPILFSTVNSVISYVVCTIDHSQRFPELDRKNNRRKRHRNRVRDRLRHVDTHRFIADKHRNDED